MSNSVKIDLFARAAVGGDGANDIRLRADAALRLSQQYAEVIHSGGDNRTRLSQQYAEVIHSGGNNKVRLSQAYLEIITDFGSPPPGGGGPGKSGDAPGHNKPPQGTSKWLAFQERERKHRSKQTGRFSNTPTAFSPTIFLPFNQEFIKFKEVTATVRI